MIILSEKNDALKEDIRLLNIKMTRILNKKNL